MPRIIYPSLADSADIWERFQDIPNNIESIISNAIAFLIAISFSIGVIMAIVGAIQWATGWDDRGGKKSVVKGLVLMAISMVLGGGMLAGYMLL